MLYLDISEIPGIWLGQTFVGLIWLVFFFFFLSPFYCSKLFKNVQTARRSFAYALTPKRTDIVGLFEFEKRDFFLHERHFCSTWTVQININFSKQKFQKALRFPSWLSDWSIQKCVTVAGLSRLNSLENNLDGICAYFFGTAYSNFIKFWAPFCSLQCIH